MDMQSVQTFLSTTATELAILLGLELLVIADIIGTVAIEPTLQNLGVLAVIVAIRTILSFALELEVSGRWPWQRAQAADRNVGS